MPEINAWIVIEPDDTVIIRIAQTELGQGVWTSNAMMVCEELQCDWSKVRPQYASANRDAREMAPDWTLERARQRRDGSERRRRADVRQPRPHGRLRHSRQSLSAHADQRRVVGEGRPLLLAARGRRGARAVDARGGRTNGTCPPTSSRRKDSVITHARERPHHDLRQDRARSLRTPRTRIRRRSRIKPPEQWTLMGTEQKNLDVPMKVTGETVYAIDVRLPGHEMGGREIVPGLRRRREELRLRGDPRLPGVRSAMQFPIPDPELTRGRVFSGGVAVIADHWYQAKAALDAMPIEWPMPPRMRAFNTATCARRCSPLSTSPAACA